MTRRVSAEGPVSASPIGGLFDGPRIESEAPSQAASETSRRAAECVSNPFRRESHRRLMWVMGEHGKGWMSQWQLAQAADLPINVVCARIPELEPLWVQREPGACRSHVKPTLKVDGFMLTPAGFQRLTMAYFAANEFPESVPTSDQQGSENA